MVPRTPFRSAARAAAVLALLAATALPACAEPKPPPRPDEGPPDREAAKVQAELAATRKALAAAEAELTAARKSATEAAAARDAAVKELSAAKEREAAAAREAAGLRDRLAAAEERQTALRQDLDKSRRRLSDAAFPADLDGRARFLVELPSPDARLYIDDKLDDSADGKVVHEFLTSRVDPGKRYALDLRVEWVHDGKTFTAAKRVVFQANTEQRLSFPVLESQP
jgi:uncharacterized protein (TIGR03000 family)